MHKLNHLFIKFISRQTAKGFTLAEVLITLVIIGVVASLTIPALLTNIQDAQLKTAWKKTYADLNQASQKFLIDNKSYENLTTTYNHSYLRNKFLEYMNYTKKCNLPFDEGCWNNVGKFYYLNGDPITSLANSFLGTGSGAILNNGTLILFGYEGANCNVTYKYEGLPYCGWITVDVNGFKGPNTFGKDIFGTWIFENNIKPAGIANFKNSCTSSSSGFGCAAEYLYN